MGLGLGLGLGLGSGSEMMGLGSMRGRSWASSILISSSSKSVVPRLMQEQRSSEAKKAEAMLEPTQMAARSRFSHDMKLQFLSIVVVERGEDGVDCVNVIDRVFAGKGNGIGIGVLGLCLLLFCCSVS